MNKLYAYLVRVNYPMFVFILSVDVLLRTICRLVLFPFFVFWFVLVEIIDLLKRIICDLPDVLKWPFETIESVYIAITDKKLVLAWFKNYKKEQE